MLRFYHHKTVNTELKIDSERLYRFILKELDKSEREIICKRYGVTEVDGSLCDNAKNLVNRARTFRELRKVRRRSSERGLSIGEIARMW